MTAASPEAAPWSAAAFESRYRASIDPWSFATSPYERNRYATILRALRRPHFENCYEPGCSVGELTALLAGRCKAVYASDVAPSAVAAARRRCAGLPNVEIECAALSEVPLRKGFDLMIFSEIGYYFPARTLARIAAGMGRRLDAGAEFVAVHWLGHSPDHRLHGDEVHRILRDHLPLRWVHGEVHPGFRIDSWTSS